jgi:hypothetical protein
MKMKNGPRLYYLDKYGLNISSLKRLGNRKIEIDVYLEYPKYEKWFKLNQDLRKQKIIDFTYKEFEKLKSLFPQLDVKRYKSKQEIIKVKLTINAKDIVKFNNADFVESVWLYNIEGLKRPRDKKDKYYYAVNAIFAIQIEGITGGMQQYEERIILVKAYSYEEAERKALKEFKDYGYTYLNSDKLMVRWKFEKIIDVYNTHDNIDKINPSGMEVYSHFRYRKLTKEREWHPLKGKLIN